MEKYIGLDVHSTSCTAVVVDARGKQLSTHVIETNGQALINFIKTQAGRIHLCMEEGTQSGWLAEILSPHVFKLAVVGISPRAVRRTMLSMRLVWRRRCARMRLV